MTVLFRWIFFSTLTRVAAITVAVVLIFILAESIDKARYLGDGLTLSLLTEYMVLKIPMMISEFMPVVVLIGVAIYVLDISYNHELAALRAAGTTMWLFLKPLLAAGAVVAFFMFAMSEWVEPLVNKRLSEIDRVYIEKEPALKQGTQWLHEGSVLMRLSPLTQNYFSMLMLDRDERGLWVKRIDANKAHYVQGKWQLEQVYISQPNAKGFSTLQQDSLTISSNLSPQTVAAPDPRDMQWFELYRFEKALSDAGLEARTYMFQLQRKLAAPLSCLIMVILAYSLCSSMGQRTGAKSKGLLLSITAGLIFYVTSSAIGVLATGEQLPAIYAAWLPNILFAGLAGYLLLQREGY